MSIRTQAGGERELLELAARAAGILGWWSGNDYCYGHNDNPNVPVPWRPLTDDGDALRLAVKLDFSSLMYFDGESNARRRAFWSPNSGHDGGKSEVTAAEYASDPYAATRRAIVRAAAAIAQQAEMPQPGSQG